MSPSSSRSDADTFAYLVARGPVADATRATAWVQALLDVEVALTAAHAAAGQVPESSVSAVEDAAAATIADVDIGELLAAAELGGNAVIPLVPRLRALVGDDVAAHVHRGATSQDIVDTALMLVVRRARAHVVEGLEVAAGGLAALAEAHGEQPMIARTLLQHAVPTTFGAVAGSWSDSVRSAIDALAGAALPVQLGGPAGDAMTLGPRAADVVATFAARLQLDVPGRAWHANRAPVAAIAAAWGVAASAVAGVATDIVLLAGSDVAEVIERAEGAGLSSSMTHKRNPIAAVSARASAMQVPGLVSTVLHCAGGHELQRAAGAWHAEWPAMTSLLCATGSAVDWLATSVSRLDVDSERMAANLATANTARTEENKR